MRPDVSGVEPLALNLATRLSVGDMLTRSAFQFPDRPAIVQGDEEITYARLDELAEAFGRGLLDTGLERQEPVAFLLGNSWRFVATFFGCAKAALVAMPVNLMLPPDEVAWILADAGVRVVVADPAFVPLLEQVLPDLPQVTAALRTTQPRDARYRIAAVAAAGLLDAIEPDRDLRPDEVRRGDRRDRGQRKPNDGRVHA